VTEPSNGKDRPGRDGRADWQLRARAFAGRIAAEPGAIALWGGLGLLLILAAAAMAIGGDKDGAVPVSGDRARIERIVRDYILEHPEIIPEAIKRLQDREVAKVLDSSRQEFETPFGGAWAGAEDGDVVLVEFFDYACPYCRSSVADVDRLLKEDKRLKVVWRDFPVLGPQSEEAAMASLSAARQNRYQAFYGAMFDAGRPSRAAMIKAVRAARLDEGRTGRDLGSSELKAEIAKNLDLGRTLGLTGTPSYMIGDRILSGAVGYDELKQAVAEARASR
jgi:protein-disulfide isomerase